MKKRGEGKVRLRESSARCQQKGETKPAGQSEEGESGKPREGKEVGKEEGKAGGFRGRSRCNFCGRLSRRSRRGKRRIQSQSVSQAAAGGGERRRIKDGHQPLRGTATAPHFPGWSLRGGPALMERRSPRSAEAEAAAAAAAAKSLAPQVSSVPFPRYSMRIDWMHFPQLTVQLLLPAASSA